MPRETAALLVVSGKGRDSWLLSALLSAVLDSAEQEVFVEWAPTLAKALERLTARSWQAALVDEQVGDETGLEVVRQARKRAVAVPMVLCMAHEDKTLEDIALEEGVAEVLPLSTASPRRLGQVLHSAMMRGRGQGRNRAAGDRYAQMFAESPVAMSLTSVEDGRFLDVNAAFCRLLGYGRDEIVGHTSQELGMWAEDRTRNTLRARLKETGTVEGMETLLQDREGRLLHVLSTSRLMKVDGKPCILALTMDITGQRRAESDLERRDEQLEAAERVAGWGSWDVEVPTGRMRWSPNLERMLGLADLPRTLEGYLQRVGPADRDRVAEAFRRATQRGAPLKVVHGIQLPSGEVREMELMGMPEFDVQDEALAISGTVRPAEPSRPRREQARPPKTRTPRTEGLAKSQNKAAA
ncbi:MAG: PAS domain S-box protein [Thermoplasmatota archaeon]